MILARFVRVIAVASVAAAIAMPADAARIRPHKRIRLHKPKHGFQIRMTPFVVAPGADREGCEYTVAPNREPMDVQSVELKATPGTHHFVVWEYLGADRNPADFWTGIKYSPACVGLGPSGFPNADLFGMLPSRVQLRFPPGIAVRLEPHAVLYPNLHYHNYFDAPVLGQAVFNVIPAPSGTVQHHAQLLTVGSVQIDIPPNGTATLTGEWHAPVDLNLVMLSTHQHRRGTMMTVHHVDASGNDLGELVASTNWEHPSVQWFAPATRLPAGDGLRFTCDWSNPDDVRVHFGPTTEDEMCFVAGYFYLDDDAATVSGPGCIPQGSGLICFVANVP